MEDSKQDIVFISIVPNLAGGEGHTMPYHQAVSQGIQPLGWKHKIFVPQTADPSTLSSNWLPCLYPYDLEAEGHFLKNLIKIYHGFRLGINLANLLKKEAGNSSQTTIIFLERFIHLQLFALCLALWLIPQNQLFVWLLYRRDIHFAKTRGIYNLLNQLIKFKLPPHHFQLLTDSELLSQSLTTYFQEQVQVVPIPHTYFQMNEAQTSAIIWCWWPGSPRPEKGWKIIQTLTEIAFIEGKKVGLMAASNANLISHPQGIQLKLLPNQLNRKEYDYWLSYCDIVLLPYDSSAYQERTSGIFTEALIAGKIPLVTQGTWMEYELKKYDLAQDLAVNWQPAEHLLKALLEIAINPMIKDKLKIMQSAYQDFHEVNYYGKCLKTLYQNTLS